MSDTEVQHPTPTKKALEAVQANLDSAPGRKYPIVIYNGDKYYVANNGEYRAGKSLDTSRHLLAHRMLKDLFGDKLPEKFRTVYIDGDKQNMNADNISYSVAADKPAPSAKKSKKAQTEETDQAEAAE